MAMSALSWQYCVVMNSARDFVELLTLEPLGADVYRGTCHSGSPMRAFGGQVAAQSLIAAGHTVGEERVAHSLHGYFIRGGRTDQPIEYHVDRTRDGGSFTTRRVTAEQDGKAIFSLSASFQVPEAGTDHQPTMPQVPRPEELTADKHKWTAWFDDEPPVPALVLDLRFVGDSTVGLPDVGNGPRQRFWVRVRDDLPDESLLHTCALTYISDVNLVRTVNLTRGTSSTPRQVASLDHAVWLHRPFRADEWLLFTQEVPNASGGRGLARGQIYSEDGVLVASVMQEALLRDTPPSA
ncbi:acyl-CoA thioesterase-2 [Rhodococcus tukisamuensis]|uniref:Acyl-CoA thioesterase 2 n=2 Tax=Rhodococcus tukisamuensis TaxID=168276 RepID=A0A1G6XCN4_9NOCA|nr:acyl-CoA thioesterase-2 [Rhodococcus tukisamuensis]